MNDVWFHICQGLMLLFFVGRFVLGVVRSVLGCKIEPTGAIGVFVCCVWAALSASVLYGSGALSTIVGGGR